MNIFVSYSTKDLTDVDRFKNHLTLPGINIFVSHYSEEIGKPLAADISSALNKADVFLLLWSSNADASKYVQQEIGYAKKAGKLIVPIELERGIPLPGFIGDVRALPAYDDQEKAHLEVQRLILGLSQTQTNQQLLGWVLLLGLLWLVTRGK